MAKWRTPIAFRGKKEKKRFEANEEFEMTVARAEEVTKNIKKDYNIDLNLERLDGPEKEEK